MTSVKKRLTFPNESKGAQIYVLSSVQRKITFEKHVLYQCAAVG